MIILGKTKRLLLGAMAIACLAAPVQANPSGPTVRHGQVNITPGVQTQIQQLTDQAIVDWNSFSIGQGEAVRILQPSALSVMLNRVTGLDPSVILGTLEANGNIFLVNRNGILFGPESTVNVGGLVASTLNISNEDFLSGNYHFSQVPQSEMAAVVNQGKITVSPGGYAVLTGPTVINEGAIIAHAGKVVLASGEQATLNLDGRDLVHFSLGGQVSEGPVLLAPGMLSETIATTLGVAPTRQANQIVRDPDGSVRLVNSSGTLVNSGEVNADALPGGTAGSVLLDSSDLTVLTEGSLTTASGVGLGSDGGEVLVLSHMEGDRTLGFTHVEEGARIAATGGETGDGGFIEVSGNRLNLHGEHDLSAPGGTAGSFLLDPISINVINGDNAPTTVGDVTTMGHLWLTGDATGTNYTFTATEDIIFDLGTTGNNPAPNNIIDFSAGGALALTIEAGTDAVELGDIDLGDDGITLTGLDFLNFIADGDVRLGDSTIQVAGPINSTVGGLLDFESSTIQVTNRGDINLFATTRIEGGTASINPGAGVNTNGFLQLSSDGSIDLEGINITIDADEVRPLVITAGTNLDLGNSVIDVFSQGTGGGKGLILTAGGDIDVGTVDLTLRDDLNNSGNYRDLIQAGGRIFSSDTGGNTYSLNFMTESDFDIIANDGIILPNLLFTVDHVHAGNAQRDLSFQAGDGDLDLRNATLSVAGEAEFLTNQNLFFNNTTLETSRQGDIALDAGGDITLESAVVNQNAPVDSTGFLSIQGGGAVSLGNSHLEVDGDEVRPLVITAGTDLNLGSTVIDVFSQGTGGIKGLILTAGGDIDVGTVDLTFRDDINNSGSYRDLIQAGGRIFSSDTGGNTYSLNFMSESDFDIIANDGILLPNLIFTVDHVHNTTAQRDLSFQAGDGDLDLRNATISVAGEAQFLTNQNLFFNSTTLNTSRQGDIALDAGGDITLESAVVNQNAPVDSTGFLSIQGGGAVSLGNSHLEVDGDEVRPLVITAGTDLNLGSTVIDVFSQGTGGTKGLILTAGGDIDVGTVDLTLRDDLNSSGNYRDLIQAGGRIFSSGTGGNPYSFNFTTENDLDFIANDSISLPDLNLTANHVNAGFSLRDLSFQAGDGDLDLRNATISVEGEAEFLTNQNLFFNSTTLDTSRQGDIALDAGGDVTLEDALINENPGTETTGFIQINAGGAVSLGNSVLKVDGDEVQPFSITAGTNLDLGSALIDIISQGTGGDKGLRLTAGGDIDLGTVDLTFRDDLNSSGGFENRISAGGSVLSTPEDGNTSNRPGRLDLVGSTVVQADSGSVDILDFDVLVNPEPGAATANLSIQAPTGSMDFGESRFSVQNDLNLVSQGALDLSTSDVTVDNRLTLGSNGGVSALPAGSISVPDLQIFGYNSTTMAPDPMVASNGDVTLGLVTAGNTDLSIFATGDIDVTHTGGGSITAERIGLEGSGVTGAPSAVRSTGGNVSLVSDGTINLGKGASDNGAALVRSDAMAEVTIQADQLVNSVTSGTNVLDAQSGGVVNIIGPTSAEALEVSAPGVSVSLENNPNSSARVNIVGDSDFLKVAGNQSDIEVTELLSGNQLTMKQQTSDFVLTVDPLSIEGILYTDQSEIALGDINTTSDQTLTVSLDNTAGITAAPTGFNLNVAGDLLLVAGGDIGTAGNPLAVPGGRTSIVAGGQANIETSAADLTVAEVRQFDPFGNEVAMGEGFQSVGDLTIQMTGSGTVLTQEEVIRSSGGNVAIDIVDGSLMQDPGAANPAPEISGNTVALAVSGDVGTFDTGVATPIRINADALVIDGGNDVVLEQPVGDVDILDQATISGTTYTTTGAAGDFRLQAGTGAITVSADLAVGGEAALVTGNDLNLNAQTLPNSINLNGSLTSGQNLVVLSNGDIVQSSGVLTAPAIGLGAGGTIGTTGSPVNIQTSQLALNPSNGFVSDPDGFTQVQSVTAAGVTVNQGVNIPTPPPVEPEQPPTQGPVVVDVELTANVVPPSEEEIPESVFAQNNIDLVESYLDELLEGFEYFETDPTEMPLTWYNDDDFLRRKFRR